MKQNVILFTLLLLTVGLKAQTQQEWRDSVSILSAMIDRSPNDVELRLRKAAFNIELGQWQYALDEYSAVLTIAPDNLTALYYRGFVYQHLGRYALARQDYEHVLRIEPFNSHALMGLVTANLADGRPTQAFDGANRLVNMFPDNAEGYAIRSEVEIHLNMLDAALDDINKAVEIEDVKVRRKYPVTIDDDITVYQLSAFSLYMQLGHRRRARQALDYLVTNGLPKAALDDYYAKLGGKKK